MKEVKHTSGAICPICGKTYYDYPATSRKDQKTDICPECGILESLETLGISEEERYEILNIVKTKAPKTDN